MYEKVLHFIPLLFLIKMAFFAASEPKIKVSITEISINRLPIRRYGLFSKTIGVLDDCP